VKIIHTQSLRDDVEMLLAILLWLGCITAPNTYYQSQIDSFESQNQAVIDGVMASPTQQAYVWSQCGAATENVQVIDPYR